MITANQLQKNRELLAQKLKDNSAVVLHSGYIVPRSADGVFPFSVNRNFYYLTGLNQDNIILLMVKLGGKLTCTLFMDKPDPEKTKWLGASFELSKASELSGISEESIKARASFNSYFLGTIQPLRAFEALVDKVYLDLEQNLSPLFNSFGLDLARTIQSNHPALSIENVYPLLVNMRMIKNEEEVSLIKRSIAITHDCFLNVWDNATGLTKEAVAHAIYESVNIMNGTTSSFAPIVASGKNAVVLHYITNNEDIIDGSLILIDAGTWNDCYASDITRTFPKSGKFTQRQKEVYEVVLKCNKEVIAFLKPGLSWKEVNDFAKGILLAGCKEIGLIKEDKDLDKYYYHSVGHSLGLDVHDPVVAGHGIVEGMVITVEPGLYIAEESIGIRIEDNVYITKKGAINLSVDIPKEVEDLESFIK